MDSAFLISAFATLFVVIDPIGLSPLFVAMTAGMEAKRRRAIAVRACVIAVAILLAFALFGEALLGFVGISMAAFKIAGGALLFLTALDMLFERRQSRREDQADDDSHADPSVFPLALPLIAGPGAIATMILLVSDGTWATFGAVSAVMISVILVCFVLFLAAPLFERVLGKTGINIVTRILGMLLAALSVQFVLDGLAEFGIGLG
ncbi:MarC family protein [Algirhabdus cladophorae]|uniref:MarC family protein n=1 Tax=Algirhabdus cladophorae TaxID=3377108 RepID=UPI003B8457B6